MDRGPLATASNRPQLTKPRLGWIGALLLVAPLAASAQSPDLNVDFTTLSQWLSHELAQGLAFNAGSNFDPPKEVKGYYVQPDLSLGVGRMPFNKSELPTLTTPALQDQSGTLFPDSVLFPNLALHLRIGLPWRGDAYVRFADATTPAGYKISPTIQAKVQSNSYGFGVRQHFFGGGMPMLTLGAHFNHVQGSTYLNGKFGINVDNVFTDDSDVSGALKWNLNSYGVTAVVSQSFDRWTPFLGMGYNYTSGSVSTSLSLDAHSILVDPINGSASDRPEQNQGREIFGLSYDRSTWSLFANAELKALGALQYRSFIIQFGGALPFDIGRGPAIFYHKRPAETDVSTSVRTAAAVPPSAPPAPRSAPPPASRLVPPPAPSVRPKPDPLDAPVHAAPLPSPGDRAVLIN